jgi:hypothetical protein
MNNIRSGRLSGAQLKVIAIISMAIDHTAIALIQNVFLTCGDLSSGSIRVLRSLYILMRSLGRLAFPIYCFFLVQGFLYTHSRRAYTLRLLLFGFLSEIPFDLALYGTAWYPFHQNVMFELAAAVIMLALFEAIRSVRSLRIARRTILLSRTVSLAAAFLSSILCMIIAETLRLDYGWMGLCLILLLYVTRTRPGLQCAAGAAFTALFELPGAAAFLLLYLYNGQRGRQKKYFFYAFYPAHLLLLAAAEEILIQLPL